MKARFLFLFTHVVCHHVGWELYGQSVFDIARFKIHSCTGIFMPLDLSFVLRDFLFNYSLFSAYSLASEWETWQDLYLLKRWLFMWVAVQTFRLV